MPHMKAINVPFHLMYSSLMCSKGLESDRSKWRGMLAEVSRASLCKTVRKHVLSGVKTGGVSALCLSLGCLLELSMLSYLIWKRTSKATCWYENQDYCPTDRYFMIIFWRPAEVYQWGWIFWPVTWQPLEADLATIPHMKGDIHSSHMRHCWLICSKR